MNYDEKYINAEYLEVCGNMLKGDQEQPCWHCGKPTTWMDIDFQAHLCSDECSDAKWSEYIAAFMEGQ